MPPAEDVTSALALYDFSVGCGHPFYRPKRPLFLPSVINALSMEGFVPSHLNS